MQHYNGEKWHDSNGAKLKGQGQNRVNMPGVHGRRPARSSRGNVIGPWGDVKVVNLHATTSRFGTVSLPRNKLDCLLGGRPFLVGGLSGGRPIWWTAYLVDGFLGPIAGHCVDARVCKEAYFAIKVHIFTGTSIN